MVDSSRAAWRKEDFEKGKLLGSGGFGEVHLVREKTSKFIVALKTVKLDKLSSDARRYLMNEIRIHQELNHEGVVKMFGWFLDKSSAHLIIEFCPKGALSKRMPFSEKTSSCFVSQIASALLYCHSHGVIHRDIKPENVLLGYHHKVKLADFGLATFSRNMHADSSVGTNGFQAPEITAKQPYSQAVDLWALGMMILELLDLGKENYHESIYKANISAPARSLLEGLLKEDARQRMTTNDVLRHDWICLNSCHRQ